MGCRGVDELVFPQPNVFSFCLVPRQVTPPLSRTRGTTPPPPLRPFIHPTTRGPRLPVLRTGWGFVLSSFSFCQVEARFFSLTAPIALILFVTTPSSRVGPVPIGVYSLVSLRKERPAVKGTPLPVSVPKVNPVALSSSLRSFSLSPPFPRPVFFERFLLRDAARAPPNVCLAACLGNEGVPSPLPRVLYHYVGTFPWMGGNFFSLLLPWNPFRALS